MKKIKYKIAAIAISATVLTGAFLSYLSMTYTEQAYNEKVEKATELLRKSFDRSAQLSVENAISAIENIYKECQSGLITPE